MDDAHIVDIGEIVDRQRLTWFHAVIFAIAGLQVFIDGYDTFVPGFVGPALVRAWHLPPGSLGPMFTSGLLGIVVGAPLSGWLGDRYGRKNSMVVGSVVYAVLTLASMWVTTITELTWLRFFTGLGLAGIIPNALALTAEFAPKRLRATLITVVGSFVAAGVGVIGAFASLVPVFGWQFLFLAGGLMPLFAAIVTQLWMPESIKYLAASGRTEAVVRLLKKVDPHFVAPAGARFTVTGIELQPGLSPVKLFQGGLGLITSMVWIAFTGAILTQNFLGTWLPTLLQRAGGSPHESAILVAFMSAGGIVGGLVMMWLIDRCGTLAFPYAFVVSMPCLVGLGWPGLGMPAACIFAFGSGSTTGGMIRALNTTVGIIYPTTLRSKGIGWCLAVGRLFALAGPLVAGLLVAMKFDNLHIFAVVATWQIVGVGACVVMTRATTRRFRGRGLDDKSEIDAAV